jgi:sugar lactone lactonase YvrE
VVTDGLSLSNGIGFSLDDQLMYLADSLAGAVYRIPYDLELGELDEVLGAVEESDGLPDGLAVDADGVSGSPSGEWGSSAATPRVAP